jgi:hypothetical protein
MPLWVIRMQLRSRASQGQQKRSNERRGRRQDMLLGGDFFSKQTEINLTLRAEQSTARLLRVSTLLPGRNVGNHCKYCAAAGGGEHTSESKSTAKRWSRHYQFGQGLTDTRQPWRHLTSSTNFLQHRISIGLFYFFQHKKLEAHHEASHPRWIYPIRVSVCCRQLRIRS